MTAFPRFPARSGALALVAGVAVVACSGSDPGPSTSPTRAPTASSTTTTRSAKPAATTVTITTAPFTLPRGSARAALVADRDHLLLLGGLDSARNTTSEVLEINPTTGTVSRAGSLAVAVHDTAGALVNGVPTIFGGGNSSETGEVQAFGASATSSLIGRLPIPRSDLGAATVGSRTFLVGGYDGSSVRATTLSTDDGKAFQVLGDLPTPVRYAAVAALDGLVYAIGGTTTGNARGAVRTVQVLDQVTGVVRTVGDLPITLTDAVAATVRGNIYVFGGIAAGAPSAQVWRLDLGPPGNGHVALQPVGTLATPAADAAVAVLGRRAYLVGGESPAMLRTISVMEVP